jgi:hypothetical protein
MPCSPRSRITAARVTPLKHASSVEVSTSLPRIRKKLLASQLAA